MDTQPDQLHFVLFPFMAQGHMIPMIDIAKLIAQRGVIITIFTTPVNADRFKSILDRAIDSGLKIRVIQFQFSCVEVGLPEGCENTDTIPSLDLFWNFLTAADKLLETAEKLFGQLQPRPSCIVSDVCLPYTSHIAAKFNLPRIVFHGGSCFSMACFKNIYGFKILETVVSESEYFVIPALAHKVEFTKPQINFMTLKSEEFQKKMFLAAQATYGNIVNSFEELEPDYIKDFKKTTNGKFWCIGPVSLYNTDYLDKAQRGSKASVDEQQYLKWLDSQHPGSVVYACFGSVCNLISSQLMELGLGLEASNKPFIWVIKDGETSNELKKWVIEDGFEERIQGRGLVVWGWAPQVLILSHPAIGGFLTHCGWNSTLESISAGVPLLTWPLFEDQFMNEKLIVQILKFGVRVGVEEPMKWGEEENIGVLVKREEVKNAVDRLMDEGKEGEERRERARELAKMGKAAVQAGGSSHINITLLLKDIMEKVNSRRQSNT